MGGPARLGAGAEVSRQPGAGGSLGDTQPHGCQATQGTLTVSCWSLGSMSLVAGLPGLGRGGHTACSPLPAVQLHRPAVGERAQGRRLLLPAPCCPGCTDLRCVTCPALVTSVPQGPLGDAGLPTCCRWAPSSQVAQARWVQAGCLPGTWLQRQPLTVRSSDAMATQVALPHHTCSPGAPARALPRVGLRLPVERGMDAPSRHAVQCFQL